MQSEGRLHSHGSFISWATSTSHFTQCSYSLLTISKGDRGGHQICIRVTQTGQPMNLHRFWDGEATTLRTRQEFQRASSPNLRTQTLNHGQKRATRLRRRLLIETMGCLVHREMETRTARL